jgi:enoyl-CoA hydratase
MADDAQMGYPAVRFGVPDMHFHPWFLGMRKAMEMFMTGDSVTGIEAERYGWANASYPADQLEAEVLKVAEKISKLPLDVLRLNKRAIHRQMEAMGLRTGIRAGTELCALGTHTESMANFVADIQSDGLTGALDRRDSKFGDYRTTDRSG